MKLIETLIDLIVEAAPEQIYQKYYSDIERPTFLRIIGLDPATKIQNDEEGGIKKIGKYSKLLLKMHKEGNLKPEDYPKAKDYLSLVYKHGVPVDLNKIKTLGDLFGLVEKYYSQDKGINVFDLINTLQENEYELLHSGEKWVIYRPISEKGAAYLGTNTQWCTAWGPYSTDEKLRSRGNHFASHNNKGWLYVIINRENPEEKYQFHFETKQFMNKNDSKIDTGEFLQRHSEVTKYFFPSLFDDTPVDPDEIDRMEVLNASLTSKLVERVIGETDNDLITTLINDEGDELINKLKSVYITDPNVENIKFDYFNSTVNSPTLIFEVDITMSDDLMFTLETSNAYASGANDYNGNSDWLRDDIVNSGDEEWLEEQIEPLIKQYFDTEVTYSDNYEEWREIFKSDFYDDLVNDFGDEYAYLNDQEVSNAHQVELDKREKYIILDENTIQVTPPHLALFLHREKLTKVNDILSLFEAYVNYHDLTYDYENPFWEQPPLYPTMQEMKSHFDGYNEKMEEIVGNTTCVEEREKLKTIKHKFFGGGRYFRRDDLRIELNGGYICDKNDQSGVSVKIDYLEKNPDNPDVSNWKRWLGIIDLERLVEYITNERLFEGYTK